MQTNSSNFNALDLRGEGLQGYSFIVPYVCEPSEDFFPVDASCSRYAPIIFAAVHVAEKFSSLHYRS